MHTTVELDAYKDNRTCHDEATEVNDKNNLDDTNMEDDAGELFHINKDQENNNITSNRELIGSTAPTASEDDRTMLTKQVPRERDSHIIRQTNIDTANNNQPSEEPPSEQHSDDTKLKTVMVCTNDEEEEETIEEIIPVKHQRGLMSKADRWKIQRHTDYLVNQLDAIELINKLYSQFVFGDDDYDLLLNSLETKGRYRCITHMLRILRRECGPNSYIQFLVALERCGYTWVIKTLEPGCGIYKGKMKYSGQKFYELIDNTSPKYKEFVKRCENNIEQVYQDKPGQQFVVVKKLEKGCVEVTFHLISLGSNDEEGLRSCLQDVVQSGFIDSDPVESDSFTFHRITEEEIATERQSMKGKQVKDLENEIQTLKLEIIDLKVENDALKSESVHSTEIQKFKELEANKYKEKLQELVSEKDLVIWNIREQLDQEKQDNYKFHQDLDKLHQDLDRLQPDLDRLQSDNKTLRQEKDKLEVKLVEVEQMLEEENRGEGERISVKRAGTVLRRRGLAEEPKKKMIQIHHFDVILTCLTLCALFYFGNIIFF
ncbi:uncharacterized protein LOC126816615 isoform X1 [Patella vulgata]|uniref:uncharacterized protein LOC126816615 isoform X1 n=1 Tax=Patella vulgata TaxID=6465 RepID=UPI0024A8254D|nr:uncharacterized protein LOC126816615 isoform X1 [Patella vulgata]XP_055955649.1 uncharacterized protein LOC126816615 isoform X1 [Patella vulgata]